MDPLPQDVVCFGDIAYSCGLPEEYETSKAILKSPMVAVKVLLCLRGARNLTLARRAGVPAREHRCNCNYRQDKAVPLLSPSSPAPCPLPTVSPANFFPTFAL